MNLNMLEIVIVAVFLLLVVFGMKEGLARKLASVLSLLITVALISVLLPNITAALKEKTPVYDMITTQVERAVQEQFKGTDSLNLSTPQQQSLIGTLPLPQFMKNQLISHNSKEGYQSLKASTFQDYIVNYVSTAILNALSFVTAVILVQLLVKIVIHVLQLLTMVPGIHLLNRLAGGAIGFVEGLFLLWLFFLLVSAFSATEWGLSMMAMIQQSKLLGMLYESNLFVRLVLRAAAIFV